MVQGAEGFNTEQRESFIRFLLPHAINGGRGSPFTLFDQEYRVTEGIFLHAGFNPTPMFSSKTQGLKHQVFDENTGFFKKTPGFRENTGFLMKTLAFLIFMKTLKS